MNLKQISFALAALGSGALLSSGCNKNKEATEVPGASSESNEASCGGKKAEGGCGGTKSEAACGAEKAEAACGGEKAEASCGGAATAESSDEELDAPPPVDTAGVDETESAEAPAEPAKPVKKKRKHSKKKKPAEEACGEGTCG